MPINSQIAYLMWLWTHWPSGSVTNLSGPWLMWWIPNKNDWLSRMAPSVSRHWNVLCLCLIAPNTDILLHLYSYRHLFTDTCLPTPVLIQMICLVRYSIFSRGFTMHLHLRLIPPIMKIWERNAKVSPDVETFTAVLGESECVHRNCQIKCLDNVHISNFAKKVISDILWCDYSTFSVTLLVPLQDKSVSIACYYVGSIKLAGTSQLCGPVTDVLFSQGLLNNF